MVSIDFQTIIKTPFRENQTAFYEILPPFRRNETPKEISGREIWGFIG